MPPDELPRMSASGSVDSDDLATQGYRQELDRSLGSFSAFAAGFSYLSLLTGLFQNFHLGYSLGGPAFFWTWPLTFLGQLAIALCFAELAAHYPVCGGVYQWSRRIGTRSIGWLAGWVYLASLVVTLAAVALALQQTLPQLWPACQLILSRPDTPVIPWEEHMKALGPKLRTWCQQHYVALGSYPIFGENVELYTRALRTRGGESGWIDRPA